MVVPSLLGAGGDQEELCVEKNGNICYATEVFCSAPTATEPVKASRGGGSPSVDFPPGRLLLAAG